MAERIDWRNLPPVAESEQPTIRPGWQPSQTFLKHHDRCDRAAMLYLIYGGGAGSHPLNRGAIWHEVAAQLTRHALAQEEPEPRIGSVEIGKEFLLDYLRDNPHLQVSAVERDALRYMIANFCMGEAWDPGKVVAIETTVTIEIGGWTIICRIDRAETIGPGFLEVVDYKTSFSLPDGEEFKGESYDEQGEPRFAGDFQTMLYALALAEGVLDDGMPLGDEYERFKLRLAYPRYLRDHGLASREVVVTRKQLLDFRVDIELQLERLEAVNFGERRWQPTPGSHCAECPAEYACPLPRLLRPESQHASLTEIDELEKAATSWFFTSRRNEQLKRRLKKGAERLGEQDPAALEIGDEDGNKGVRIGNDLALLFLSREQKSIPDKEELERAVAAAVDYGEPFDMTKHVRLSESTEFAKRKVPDRRRIGEK